MTYVINNYNGTPLVSIPDRTVNLTATSIKLPGRDYPRYGEPVVEDLVWMLQHFANTTAPLYPIDGQIWYNTTEKVLKVYDASTGTWLGTGKTAYGTTAPAGPTNGQLWFDTGTKQLKAWDSDWKLIGPIGTANETDPLALAAPTYTAVQALTCTDTASLTQSVLRISVGGTVIAVISENTFSCLSGAIPGSGLTSIAKGINLTATCILNGQVASAITSLNSLQLDGNAVTNVYLKNQTNLPTSNNTYDLGSAAYKFANVYATIFNGQATSALYADLAERYQADQYMEPGTLVRLGGEHEITTTQDIGCNEVFGIISQNPGVMLNSQAGSDSTWPYVALSGRVPLKVVGQVKKGERLMSSHIAGVAQAWQPAYGMLAIVARSLENKTDLQQQHIMVTVGKI